MPNRFGFDGSDEDFGAGVVELTFPSGDYDGGEAVADEVYAGAAHGNKVRIKKEELRKGEANPLAGRLQQMPRRRF